MSSFGIFEDRQENHEDVSECHRHRLGESIDIFDSLFLQYFEKDDIKKTASSQALEDQKYSSTLSLNISIVNSKTALPTYVFILKSNSSSDTNRRNSTEDRHVEEGNDRVELNISIRGVRV